MATITKDIIALAKKIDSAQEWDIDDCKALCDALGCEPVQVIGRRVVGYRRAPKPENRRIVLPR